MTTSRPLEAVSRRAVLAGLGVGALGLALTTRPLGATAQNATPTATPFPMANHPIIGVWQITLEPGNPGSSIDIYSFDAEGRLAAGRSEDHVAIGSWRATGERAADMILHQQDMIPPDFFAPDYAGAGPALLPHVWLWRFAVTIDPTGNTMRLAGKIDMYRDGTLEDSFDGAKLGLFSEGVRMVPVELGGTPTP